MRFNHLWRNFRAQINRTIASDIVIIWCKRFGLRIYLPDLALIGGFTTENCFLINSEVDMDQNSFRVHYNSDSPYFLFVYPSEEKEDKEEEDKEEKKE